jgi:hypothetical protein
MMSDWLQQIYKAAAMELMLTIPVEADTIT